MSALLAAETLVEMGGQSFSNLQIQKLLYIAQMFYMGENGDPMFNDDFEAWKLGPVIPAVYQRAKMYGSRPVETLFTGAVYDKSTLQYAMLDRVLKELPDKSPWQLVAITHWDKGAWAKNFSAGEFGCMIPKGDILNEYASRAGNEAVA